MDATIFSFPYSLCKVFQHKHEDDNVTLEVTTIPHKRTNKYSLLFTFGSPRRGAQSETRITARTVTNWESRVAPHYNAANGWYNTTVVSGEQFASACSLIAPDAPWRKIAEAFANTAANTRSVSFSTANDNSLAISITDASGARLDSYLNYE